MKLNFYFQKISGVLLIILGLLSNEKIISNFTSTCVTQLINDISPIWCISLILIISGLSLLLIDFNKMSISGFIDSYKYIGVTIFSTLLLFIVINVLLHLYWSIEGLLKDQDPFCFRNINLIKPLFSNLSSKDIGNILCSPGAGEVEYSPYTQFRPKAYKSEFINVSKDGYRYIKNQGPWPIDKKRINIFIFGGSTTYGDTLPDFETIPSKLQELLRNEDPNSQISVYNFGRGYYYSTQEQVLFIKQITNGIIPDVAIFIDGLNDFINDTEDPIFTENFKEIVASIHDDIILFYKLPLVQLLNNKLKSFTHKEVKRYSNFKQCPDLETTNSKLLRYLRTKRIIESLAKEFGIKTLFIWQPVPYYKYDLKYHIFAKDLFENCYSSLNKAYSFAELFFKSNDIGENFVYLGNIQEDIKKPLYLDEVHYSTEMVEVITKRIFNILASNHNYYLRKSIVLKKDFDVEGFAKSFEDF